MARSWITFYVGIAFAVLGSAHLDAAELIRISQTAAGEPSDRGAFVAGMTPDGRYVVIGSISSNLVPGLSPSAHPNLYVYDVEARNLELVSVRDNGKPAGNHSIGGGSISADGRYVVFSASDLQAISFVRGDTNHKPDLFLRDRLRGTTVMLTKSPSGGVANGASTFGLITGDGHTVVLQSTASNLTAGGSAKQSPILSLNLDTHQFARLHLASGSQVPNASSTLLSISSDGRFVAFSSCGLEPGGWRSERRHGLLRPRSHPGGHRTSHVSKPLAIGRRAPAHWWHAVGRWALLRIPDQLRAQRGRSVPERRRLPV